MIGDKIRHAVEAMQDSLRHRHELPWDLFARSCEQLMAAADQADALERRPVPATLRAMGAADPAAPVVDLKAFRARRRPRPTLVSRDGGPAA